jgi:hypothetical protein
MFCSLHEGLLVGLVRWRGRERITMSRGVVVAVVANHTHILVTHSSVFEDGDNEDFGVGLNLSRIWGY